MTSQPKTWPAFLNPHLLWILIPVFYYVKTFSPSLVGHDGDEFLFQAYQNGIAHPAGYPVYIWIGHLLMRLTGNALYTMNLLSFLSTLLALVLLFQLFRLLSVRDWVAGLVTAFFGCMPFIWKYAVISRMYNTNLLFLVLIFISVYLYDRDEKIKWLVCGAFLYGVSLGVWFGNLLMAPAILVFFLIRPSGNLSKIKSIVIFTGVTIISAAGPLLYILWRSQTLPPLGTWRNPDSIPKLILYLIKTDSFAVDFRPMVFIKERFWDYCLIVLKSVGFIGAVPMLWGTVLWLRTNRAFCVLLLFSFFSNFMFFVGFYPTRYTALSLSYLVIVLLIARGLDDMLQQIKSPKILCIAAGAALLWAQITFVQGEFGIYSKGYSVLEQSKATLRQMPPNAYLFAEWETFTSLICAQRFLGVRPDVRIYELSYQPRNYVEDGRKISLRAFMFIDFLLLHPDKPPVYTTILTDEMVLQYGGKIMEKRLFRLEGKNF